MTGVRRIAQFVQCSKNFPHLGVHQVQLCCSFYARLGYLDQVYSLLEFFTVDLDGLGQEQGRELE